jgi:DNA topoisomerase-2
MVRREIPFNPGFYKIFDEIVVNARDALVRSQTDPGRTPVKHIDIEVQRGEDGDVTVSVENDGDGIPIEEHPTEKIWVPELIFGHLLTSGNYDKTEEKIVGGKNGYGQKCLGPREKVLLYDGKIKEAEKVEVGDFLLGDDGLPRTVLSVQKGAGTMYEISQANGDPYTVNGAHTLTLCMPDHKVIFWNTAKNGWTVLWWNAEEKRICAQTEKVGQVESTTCPECAMVLNSNLARHYRRVHKGIQMPKTERRGPTKNGPSSPEAIAARDRIEEFCNTIPDDCTFDIDLQDYIKLNETTKRRLAGVRGACVQWQAQEVSLDPYILGLWLGDGMQHGYEYTCHGAKDPELIQAFEEWCSANDATFKYVRPYVYHISSDSEFRKKNCHPLKKHLRAYGLDKEKFIPREYMINSRDVRLKVLAGIIDTDGHVSRDGTRVSVTQGMNHTRLANDIVYLARSLGFCCQIRKMKTSWTHNGEKKRGEAFHMNISGAGLEEIPTRLPRKRCASPVQRKTAMTTGYITVKEIEEGEYVGIHIDGNERFLINDFTVTHNCTNIFSDSFTLATRSPKHGKRYTQTWSENMSRVSKPSIVADKATKGFVRVSYKPDLPRFPALQVEPMIEVMHTRALELAAMAGKDVRVTWNGTAIATNTFEKFVKLFVREEAAVAYERCGERWEVAAILARQLFEEDAVPDEKHVSFVNGINTRKGGKHVEKVVGTVIGDFCEMAAKKKVPVKPGQLKDAVIFFVNATIVNPAFDSQTKETLTTPATKFGSVFKTEGKLVKDLVKLGLLDEAAAILDAKANKDVKKTDGSKKRVLRGMPKLVDALWAGTARSGDCTLILTEGDSAATSAITGLSVVGRERWGVFPLRGKLLNVRDVSADKFAKNEELTAIKKILGLEQGKKYSELKSLRYGRVMVMADQDLDGSHIKGLLMNLFHAEWPELMRAGFLCSLATPLLKATRRGETRAFYSAGEFEAWKAGLGGADGTRGWTLKYYKGLGTSTDDEAKEWFEKLHEIKYAWDGETDETMSLAFSKKRADDRKAWLAGYDPARLLEIGEGGHVGFSRFIHDELIHFSNADNLRSLPSIMDGFKPSQRKILFGCLKRGLRSEVRVAQLAGYVSEHAAYHHGEASLTAAITSMAQQFVGANNVNLLAPVGQFGSRLLGGKDAASPRYIHTHLEPIVDVVFRKEDAGILKHLDDDGLLVEPETYYPVVPLLAINGCIGIGTGFSTDIPPHNPEEIVGLLRDRLEGRRATLENLAMRPWWLGFKGPVQQVSDGVWVTRGLYEWNDEKHTVTITELPVGTWTHDYKAFLDELCVAGAAAGRAGGSEGGRAGADPSKTEDGKPVLRNFEDLYTHIDIKFNLELDPDYYDDAKENPVEFEKRFKLTSVWRTSNMVAFDTEMRIVRYGCIGDMLEAYYTPRLGAYETRRTAEMERLRREATEADAKARFLAAVLAGTIDLRRAEDDDIVAAMIAHELPALSADGVATNVDAYEYLLRLRMDRVKAAAVAEQERAVAVARAAVAELEGTTAQAMWLRDLEAFSAAWTKMQAEREAALAGGGGRKKEIKGRQFKIKPKASS